MKTFRKALLSLSLSALCWHSTAVQAKAEVQTWNTNTVTVEQIFTADPGIRLTMEQIMADPDWLGRQPETAFWAPDSSTVYYQRKREGSELRDWFSRPLQGEGNGELVKLAHWHQMGAAQLVYNTDRSKAAYVFEGNVFVLQNGELLQLTRSNSAGRIAAYQHRLKYILKL